MVVITVLVPLTILVLMELKNNNTHARSPFGSNHPLSACKAYHDYIYKITRYSTKEEYASF